MTEKAITLLGSESEAHVSIEKVENINFSGRAVSASKPGKKSILPYFVQYNSRLLFFCFAEQQGVNKVSEIAIFFTRMSTLQCITDLE